MGKRPHPPTDDEGSNENDVVAVGVIHPVLHSAKRCVRKCMFEMHAAKLPPMLLKILFITMTTGMLTPARTIDSFEVFAGCKSWTKVSIIFFPTEHCEGPCVRWSARGEYMLQNPSLQLMIFLPSCGIGVC
jgi:hypothetical protein